MVIQMNTVLLSSSYLTYSKSKRCLFRKNDERIFSRSKYIIGIQAVQEYMIDGVQYT